MASTKKGGERMDATNEVGTENKALTFTNTSLERASRSEFHVPQTLREIKELP